MAKTPILYVYRIFFDFLYIKIINKKSNYFLNLFKTEDKTKGIFEQMEQLELD